MAISRHKRITQGIFSKGSMLTLCSLNAASGPKGQAGGCLINVSK